MVYLPQVGDFLPAALCTSLRDEDREPYHVRSPRRTGQDARPEGFGIQVVIACQKVKDITAMPPGVAVPAAATRHGGHIDPKGGVLIHPIAVMLSKGTMPQAALVQVDIATNQGEGVLGRTLGRDGSVARRGSG